MPSIEEQNRINELDRAFETWLKWDRNETTADEIRKLKQNDDRTIIEGRLLKRLEFGTAGLRGCMRAGFDSMNDLVIIQTTQGLSNYIQEQFKNEINYKERGIVIGYDGRHNSKRFAQLTANIFIQSNIRVYLFGKMVATPFVPFAINAKNALAGVMITASHNPKEDNGYKVYWSNGAQIISPHDKGIQKAIELNLEPQSNVWNIELLQNNTLIIDPIEEIWKLYNEKLLNFLPEELQQINAESNLNFVYTAMHGVGYPYIQSAFKAAKLQPLVPVDEQVNPDPDFPTVKFPNPEEGKSALELAFKKAEEKSLTIILANDPDADRLACAEKQIETNTWKVFNGNELGALLGWWSMELYKLIHKDNDLSTCYMLASTVSSQILKSMAKIEGFQFIETLTGFKWMGNRTTELLQAGNKVLFAFEEAIGFMFSTNVLDKDGIGAACHLATMANYLNIKYKLTLGGKLNEIYEKYGYHCTNNSYYFCHKPAIICKIFERLRRYDGNENYPVSLLNGKYGIKYVRDLTTGIDTSQMDGKAILPVSKSSQMITFTFENGLIVTLRTSGTEPKIKYYAELCAKPEEKDREKLHTILNCMVEAIIDEFLQPNLNGLIAQSD